MITRRYCNSPPAELPLGSMSVTRFAWITKVKRDKVLDDIRQGLLEIYDASVPGRVRRYFTPDQQRRAFEFWEAQGVEHRRIVIAEAMP